MLKESFTTSISETMRKASIAIKAHVLERAGTLVNFPTTQLGGEDGHLVRCKGIVVYFGVPVPNEGRVQLAEQDAVVLLPEGLFVGKPVETQAKGGSYSTSVPNVGHLRPASLATYLEYGGRALTLLDQTAQAQFHR